MAKRKCIKRILHLHCAENSDPSSGQCAYHSIKRFPKICAEARSQRHFKTNEGINYQTLRPKPVDGIENRLHRFIHRKVQRPQVKDFKRAFFLCFLEPETEGTGPI